jgi:RHS repeat-associated protein
MHNRGDTDNSLAAQKFNAGAGMSFYRARYYDPNIGKFTREDPIGFVGGGNFFAYTGNDSISLVDPFGFSPSQQCDKKCPPIPPHPGNANVDNNIWDAYFHTLDPTYYPKYFHRIIDGGDWDYKTRGYDDFGNFNYGATLAAMGVPESIILRGAGAYKLYKDHKKNQPDPYGRPWDRNGPFGNEPDKNDVIQRGIDYYRNGCTQPLQIQPFGKPWDGPLS